MFSRTLVVGRCLLRDGDGGKIYMTPAHTLDRAREELECRYGERLVVVTPVGNR